jgi:hypothetical protein
MIPMFAMRIRRAGGNAAMAPATGRNIQDIKKTACQKTVKIAIVPTSITAIKFMTKDDTAVAIRLVG